MLLLETPLRILTRIQSIQNNFLRPQEIIFWQRFYKSCRAVGTRSSFSVRWFVSLTLLRMCCASNSPNMKVSMDWSPPHISTVLLISSSTCCIKIFTWSWEQEQEVWGFTYLQQIKMSFLIMIGTHSWGRLFSTSVCRVVLRGRHLLSYWGSLGYPFSWGYWGSLESLRSQSSQRYWASWRFWLYQGSPESPVDLASRAFCVSWESQGSWHSGGSWGCGGSWAYW